MKMEAGAERSFQEVGQLEQRQRGRNAKALSGRVGSCVFLGHSMCEGK